MVHIPKDVPVFLDFLPTNLRDCLALLKVYGQWYFTAEDQGKEQLAKDFGHILDHLRYRYIKIQNLSDPESLHISRLYEEMMPVEFHFSVVEQNDVEPKSHSSIEEKVELESPDSISIDPVVVDPPTIPASETPIEADAKQEKMRILTQVVTGKSVTVDDIQTVIDIDAIMIDPAPIAEIASATICVDEDTDNEVKINTPEVFETPDPVFVQPKKLGTLRELQEGLEPVIQIGKRRRQVKPHVRQMIKNLSRGGIILREPDGNVAARNLIRAYSGCAIVYQKDYICISHPEPPEGQIISPRMREFILSTMSESKAYDYQ